MASESPATVASHEIKRWEAQEYRWCRSDVSKIEQIIPELVSKAMAAELQDDEALRDGVEALNDIAVWI